MAEGILTLELTKSWGKYPPLLTSMVWYKYKERNQRDPTVFKRFYSFLTQQS